jgi:hypothetical protein
MRTRSLAPAALLLLFAAGTAAAQVVPLELEFGYRFVKVDGNSDEYRSQINERAGFLLRNITFATSNFDGSTNFVDHVRIDGSDLGIGPTGALRMEAGRAGLYNLRFFYRRAEQFSALPDFANPLFPTVIPGQHTYNRGATSTTRRSRSSRGVILRLGYTRNDYSVPGARPNLGQDEFRRMRTSPLATKSSALGPSYPRPAAGRFLQG